MRLLNSLEITIASRNGGTRRALLDGVSSYQPVIEFRTCFKMATIPFGLFLEQPGFYDNEERVQMIETTLLFEILNAIGGYSIM